LDPVSHPCRNPKINSSITQVTSTLVQLQVAQHS
jgi:hypothetical protein